jgi:hypothetical protein
MNRPFRGCNESAQGATRSEGRIGSRPVGRSALLNGNTGAATGLLVALDLLSLVSDVSDGAGLRRTGRLRSVSGNRALGGFSLHF